MLPVRFAENVFPATVKFTTHGPVPLVPPVMMIHDTLLLTVQGDSRGLERTRADNVAPSESGSQPRRSPAVLTLSTLAGAMGTTVRSSMPSRRKKASLARGVWALFRVSMRTWIPGVVLALAVSAPGMARQQGKVLMIVSEARSSDLELMLAKEVGVMRSLLQKAGFEVVVATASKQPLTAGTERLTPDLKLGDVRVADYIGFILPCMATSGAPLPPDGAALLKEVVATGQPVAAQTGAVVLLAKAGGLSGKKYAIAKNWVDRYPELKDGVHSGEGIVQDGRIITSGLCPYMARERGSADGTSRLTEALIVELRK